MHRIHLKMASKDYAELGPLAGGDVALDGFELTMARESVSASELARRHPDASIVETSFLLHLQQLARGDRTFVAVPVFFARAFEHRSFYVLRDCNLQRLKDLEGRQIGVERWATTGNLWGRAALAEAGVRLDRVTWVEGPLLEAGVANCDVDTAGPSDRAPAGDPGLVQLLSAGRIDAIQSEAAPMNRIRNSDVRIVRLLTDAASAERQYFERTGVFPAHHVLRVRRELAEANPWVARHLVEAISASRARWLQCRQELADVTPWFADHLASTTSLFGGDWAPHGIESNVAMLAALCEAAWNQGLISRRVDPAELFEFLD